MALLYELPKPSISFNLERILIGKQRRSILQYQTERADLQGNLITALEYKQQATGQEEGKIVRGLVTAMRREEAGDGRDAVVRMPREKAAAAGAGRAGAAARTRARSAARREARPGGVGGDGCGSVDLPRGEAAAAPRRRGGLAGVGPGGAASEWMARIGPLIVRGYSGRGDFFFFIFKKNQNFKNICPF